MNIFFNRLFRLEQRVERLLRVIRAQQVTIRALQQQLRDQRSS